MEAWTIWFAFGAAALAFAAAVLRWVARPLWNVLRALERLHTMLDTELVNGGDTEAEGYKGFREEVMERFTEGGVWMRTHERLPIELAHGVRREPPA